MHTKLEVALNENATWVRGVTKLDKIRSERLRGKRKVGEIVKKVKERWLQW